MRAITGVSEALTASHRDQVMGEGLHAHTWTVTAWFPGEPLRDGRVLKVALREVLDALPSVLPDQLWSGEALAQHVAAILPDCIGVDVDRPEGFHVSLRA